MNYHEFTSNAWQIVGVDPITWFAERPLDGSGADRHASQWEQPARSPSNCSRLPVVRGDGAVRSSFVFFLSVGVKRIKRWLLLKLKDISDNLVSGACKTVDLSTLDAHFVGSRCLCVFGVCVCVCYEGKFDGTQCLSLLGNDHVIRSARAFSPRRRPSVFFVLLFASDLWTPLVTGPRTARYTSMAFRWSPQSVCRHIYSAA